MTESILYVVATPIGNRDDLSPRARDVLGSVNLIAAEDTRHTGRLLSHFGIRTPLIALHEHNEDDAANRVLAALDEGAAVALVSDAGTPLVSDPGYRLLSRVHGQGHRVSPVPGPNAALAALSVAGLPVDRFCFEGFLPPKATARRARLASLAGEARSMVFYEAVHRVRDMLADALQQFGAGRPAFIARELTKLYEQCSQATLGELLVDIDSGRIPGKGEFVVIIAGNPEPPAGSGIDGDRLLAQLVPLIGGKQAVEVVADVTGERRNEVYRRMLALADKPAS